MALNMSASSSKPSSRKRPAIASHLQRPPINYLSEDVRDALIGQEGRSGATHIAKKMQSVDLGDRIMQRGETTPMTSFPGQASSHSSNQVSPTHNPSINTGGGGYFNTAHFTGGRHIFGTVNYNSANIDELKKIHLVTNLPHAQADYRDYEAKKNSGACFPGTRATLLREMEDWVNNPAESRMYVLSGLAGIGKSTVAYTIAERAAKLGLLSASFFFSRDDIERKNAMKFFTTIAYQLCAYDEIFAKAIRDAMLTERGYAATAKSPLEQLQILIVEPLRCIVESRTPSRPILVVVDALDECDEADERSVVMGLSQLVRLLPVFKVILTTRPQPVVDSLFFNHDGHKIFRLQDIEEKVVDSDVRLYLKHSLSLEQVQKHYPKRRWCASDEEIDFLVSAVGRLFIIASTSIRYILDKRTSNPAAQMKKLLRASAQDRMPFKDLNEFYTIILRSVVPMDCDDDIVDRYQSITGVILFVQQPLPVAILARLINKEEEEIREVLDGLQSVILLGSDDIPRVYHKSFPDYITDSTRCQDVKLCVDPGIHHTRIATRCFEIMDHRLKYNILGLGDPARFMDNEDGLKEDGITDEQLQEKIPRRLGYACVYWANHLEMANMENVDLMRRLETFAAEHMLYWFEVLSLIGKLGSAHVTVRAVIKLLQLMPSDWHQLLSDALHFISKFYGLIERSALHVYYSALPFTPTGSLLYRQYIKAAIHNVWDVDGGPEHWDALVASIDRGEEVETIKFSLNSTMFVSFSNKESVHNQGELKIWDAATGTPISTIPGQRFAVANDFSTIASSEDNTIMFYNVDGSTRGAMFTASSKIEKLALSSESSRVAAVLSNGTLYLWDSTNAELIDNFGLDTDAQIFEFSPTGTRLAYWSAYGIVKLREGISGGFVADLKCGSSPRHFVFSADGTRIAFLSIFDQLRLWNSDSGQLIGNISNVGGSLAISANGSLLATGTAMWSVTLWSENGGQLQPVKVLDQPNPQSIAFSRDNILGFATENIVKLYDVNTHSFVSTLPFSGYPTALTFSPDCARLAAGSRDGTVSLWDIGRTEASSSSQSRVTALAFSRDCSRLACGFNSGTVELWEAIPTRRRIETLMQRTLGFDPFRRGHTKRITALAFSPDGRLFASWSDDGRSIKLWNGRNGALRRTLKARSKVCVVAVSNSVLVGGWDGGVTLWTLDTLRHGLIHTFERNYRVKAVSIAENSAFAAVDTSDGIELLDIVKLTTIATFGIPHKIHNITFLSDNSHLVAQSEDGAFLSLNSKLKVIVEGPMLEHLVQLPNIPLFHGVPIWYDGKQRCLVALFSQDTPPVPVLWIPRDLHVENWTLGSSMIALYCKGGRVIFLRLLTVHGECLTTPPFIPLLNRTRTR